MRIERIRTLRSEDGKDRKKITAASQRIHEIITHGYSGSELQNTGRARPKYKKRFGMPLEVVEAPSNGILLTVLQY